jgi:hypothetical protein
MLIQQWGSVSDDQAVYAGRLTKIKALTATVAATATYVSYPYSERGKADLNNAAWQMRYLIEGSYLNRTENSLVASILGTVLTVAAIAAAIVCAMLLIQFAPVIAPATLIAASVLCGLSFLTLTTVGGRLMKQNLTPSNIAEQTNSRNIYGKANELTLFQPKSKQVGPVADVVTITKLGAVGVSFK